MRFLEFRLDEALDNPYPFNLKGPSDSQEFVATANTPNGMLRMDFETTDYDNFGIDFAVGKSMGKTEAVHRQTHWRRVQIRLVIRQSPNTKAHIEG